MYLGGQYFQYQKISFELLLDTALLVGLEYALSVFL